MEKITCRHNHAAVGYLACCAIDADEIHAVVLVLVRDKLDGFGDSFGRRIRSEFSNDRGASLILLEVSFDEVDGGVDLDILDFLCC